MLIKFVGEKKDDWQDYLDTCIFACNTSQHESSKYCPFEVMFYRKALIPVDFITPHAQRERGKVIGRGVHIYIYIYIYVCGRKKI